MMSEAVRNERRAKKERLDTYIKARAEGASARGAALEAGYSAAQAAVARRDIEPKAKKRIVDYLEQHGAGDETVARVIGEAMNAERVSKYGAQPDHFIRLKAAQFQAEVTGQVKRDVNVGVGVQINLPAGMAERWMQRQALAQATTTDIVVGNPADPHTAETDPPTVAD